MKTITLKSDEIFFEKVSNLAKMFHLSKSELIRKAVLNYEETLYKQQLKEQIKSASLKVRKNSLDVNHDFDATLDDGLTK